MDGREATPRTPSLGLQGELAWTHGNAIAAGGGPQTKVLSGDRVKVPERAQRDVRACPWPDSGYSDQSVGGLSERLPAVEGQVPVQHPACQR